MSARSSRRKPAAPQWLNPMWQDDKKSTNTNTDSTAKGSNGDDVIINGVCVMNNDYSRDDNKSPADDRASNRSDDENDANDKVGRSSTHDDEDDDDDMDADRPISKLNSKSNETIGCDKENESESNEIDSNKLSVKKEVDDSDRWDY